jgi:DNA polymerase-3 subunit epsilon
VAHNVNFDYSFVRHELERAGLKWTAKNMYRKSCKKNKTWNGLLQFRKALPIFGHRFNRHRAGGDADYGNLVYSIISLGYYKWM